MWWIVNARGCDWHFSLWPEDILTSSVVRLRFQSTVLKQAQDVQALTDVQMSFIEKKLNKSVLWAGLWDFLSFSYNRDCRTVLWKNRDWEAHNWPDCKPRENSVKILPIGIEGPYTTPVLIGFSCHAVACITFLFVLFFLIFVLLTVSMLHFSEGRPSRSDLSILVAHNDDPTGNQDLQYYNPPHLKSKM